MFWRKKTARRRDNDLVLFFASDLHGSTLCFKKFVNAARFYGANVLVLGGDVTGKAVVSVAEQNHGTYLSQFSGEEIRLKDEAELADFATRVSNMGFYPSVMTEREFRELRDDGEAQARLFKRLVIERIREWCDYASERLTGSDVQLITAPGNDDFVEIDEVLKQVPFVQFHEMEVTELYGYQILHCGGSTPTPWNTEREYTESEYETKFESLIPQVKDMTRCIFNVHVPPHETALDVCPKLDENLQVVYQMGTPVSMHAGSIAVRAAIERYQPLVSLHGHIHEGRGTIKIGKTVCVNPGSAYPEGILQGVLITLDGSEVRTVQLTQG